MLVLLEKRARYKCAKCGRLFPQRQVEAESFRRWNEAQRKTDEHNLKVESKKPKLTEEEKKQMRRAYSRIYAEKHRDKIRAYFREKWHDGTRKVYSKELYKRNLLKSRLQKRILYYRLRQKKLALQNLEFMDEGFSRAVLEDSVATKLHYEQLYNPKP